MAQKTIESTTQQFLDIYDITNDLVIMKDGTTSCILTVDAMNFGLLAEEEQDAIMYAYAGLLNSLNYPIQVIIRSQTKDVTGYLHLLQEQENEAETRENQQRIRRYREFVSNLIHERNVLDKKFYVVIPATPLELGMLSAQSVIPGTQTFDASQVEKTVIIEKAHNLLDPKRDHLISQFARIGLYSRALTTQEIIQLFYMSYNPEASEGQHIDESKSYTTSLVKASVERFPMINANNNSVPTPPDSASTGQPATQVPATPAPAQQPPMVGATTPMPSVENTTPAAVEPSVGQTPPTPGATPPNMPSPAVQPTQPVAPTSPSVPPVGVAQGMTSSPASTPAATPPTTQSVQAASDSQANQPQTAGAPQPITTPADTTSTTSVADQTRQNPSTNQDVASGTTTTASSAVAPQTEPTSKEPVTSTPTGQSSEEQNIINQVVSQAGDSMKTEPTPAVAPGQEVANKKPAMPPVAEI